MEKMQGLEEMFRATNQLTEGEAKAILKLLYGSLNTYATGNGEYTSEQLIQDIKNVFIKIPDAAN